MSGVSIYVSEDVRLVDELYQDLFGPEASALPICEQLESQVQRLFVAHKSGNPAAAIQIGNWLPELAGAELTPDDARRAVARDHGYDDWAHVQRDGSQPPDAEFEVAVDAVVHGRIDELTQMLAAQPRLATQTSSYGHRATLLHYVAANATSPGR
jgi:hypothetical protein